MILDGYWKKELRHNRTSLKIWSKLGALFFGFAHHQINKSLLFSAAIIRKMFEDEKNAETAIKKTTLHMPPLELLKYKVKVTVYPFSGDKNFIIENFIPEFYDYKNRTDKEIGLNDLCNQILHAYIWGVINEHDSDNVLGVVFSSDKAKEKESYLLEIKEFIKAIDFCIDNGKI